MQIQYTIRCYVYWLSIWFYKGAILYFVFACTVVIRSSKSTVEVGYVIKGAE
jgi:hypothetical protein